MANQDQGFWLLNSRTGWRTGEVAADPGVSVGRAGGLRLAGDAHGPLSLNWPDDSFGGVTLPRGLAWDEHGVLYLLSIDKPVVRRFDPGRKAFVRLPAVGGHGADARQFDQPANIAIAGGQLYVADRGNRRVQVFSLDRSLLLRYIWGPWDAEGRPAAADSPDAWDPADVAGEGGQAYILDARFGRVYRHRPGHDGLRCVVDEPQAAGRWERLAVDPAGNIYLLDRSRPCVDIYNASGARIGEADDAGAFRASFAPPRVRLHFRSADEDRTHARFCLPQSAGHAQQKAGQAQESAGQAQQKAAAAPPAAPPELPFQACEGEAGGLVFDREGRRASFAPDEPTGPYLYVREGVWLSQALDSHIYRCQWHRIELDMPPLPPGSQVTVSTYTADLEPGVDPPPAPPAGSPLWAAGYTFTGTIQAASGPSSDAELRPGTPGNDFLAPSGEGQYLWLKIKLEGTGYGSPEVNAVRVYFPRESYLRYLPAVFSFDDEARRFLEHFLAIFQTEWDALDRTVASTARYFDPAAAPSAGGWLENLANWLAMPLEGTWTEEQKRVLVKAAPAFYPQRGTAAGLRRYVQAYLQNMTGVTAEQQGPFPVFVEGFQERRLMMLDSGHDPLGPRAQLWGAGQAGRLQLDVFATEGEVRLVSTGDPEHDVFNAYAHRFRVFVPAVWVQTAHDETMLRRALDAEKPAQAVYDLCLVEPRLRVGVQSTVGVDTILGDYPVARLSCQDEVDAAPASRPPRQRLGYDTVLAGPPAEPMRLAPATRLEKDTILR